MKLSPLSRAGASGELFPLCPKYIVQSKCQRGRKLFGNFMLFAFSGWISTNSKSGSIGRFSCSRLHGSGKLGHRTWAEGA